MIRTALKPKSDKQIKLDAEWLKVKNHRAFLLADKYGVTICEYCGRAPWGNELGHLVGHHMDGNRKNNTPDNCYICHRICHSYITDNNLKVRQLGFEGIKNVCEYQGEVT